MLVGRQQASPLATAMILALSCAPPSPPLSCAPRSCDPPHPPRSVLTLRVRSSSALRPDAARCTPAGQRFRPYKEEGRKVMARGAVSYTHLRAHETEADL
eukprot:1521431-Rhodomonas_salina.1